MMFSARRSTNCVEGFNLNAVLYRDHDTNINLIRNYLRSPSPPPMTYRDLRSVMSAKIPSNIVILPQSLNSSQKSTDTVRLHERRKSAHRKNHKRTGIDVYRSLMRPVSRGTILPEREITNNEIILLANSFVIDHRSPTPTNGFFSPQTLPNIQKQRINNNNRIGSEKTHSSYSSSSSSSSPLRIEHVRHMRPISRQIEHPTTIVDIQYKENNNNMTIITETTMIPSDLPGKQTRKQLHVYMPQIVSC
jgi:hypothetical protein